MAAMVLIKVSRFLTCVNSCPNTPSNSSSVNNRWIPSVTATAALLGFLPVANALGTSLGMIYTFGIGKLPFLANFSTIPYSFGLDCAVTC